LFEVQSITAAITRRRRKVNHSKPARHRRSRASLGSCLPIGARGTERPAALHPKIPAATPAATRESEETVTFRRHRPRVGGATTERLDAVPPTPTNPSLSRPPPAAAGGREKGEVFGGPSVLACQSPFRRRRVGGEARNAPLRVVTWYISAGDAYRLGAEPNHGRRTINAGSGGHPAPRTRWHERYRSPGPRR